MVALDMFLLIFPLVRKGLTVSVHSSLSSQRTVIPWPLEKWHSLITGQRHSSPPDVAHSNDFSMKCQLSFSPPMENIFTQLINVIEGSLEKQGGEERRGEESEGSLARL